MDMTPQAIRAAAFRTVKRGYDPDEVESFRGQVAELVGRRGLKSATDEQTIELSVVCCDLRGFTAFTETAEPEEVMAVLRDNLAGLEIDGRCVQIAAFALALTGALLISSLPAGALLEALKKGRPGYAAVDVYEQEPVMRGDHPFLAMPNVVCTPHLGWAEWDNFDLYYSEAFEQIVAYANGQPMRLANPEIVALDPASEGEPSVGPSSASESVCVPEPRS